MATKEMCIISWNCEAISVKEQMARDLWDSLYPNGANEPDLLVVGLQEAQIKGGEFLGNILARLYGYITLADLKIHGMTKFGQIFGGFGKKQLFDKAGCYQHLAVLAKPNAGAFCESDGVNSAGKMSEKGSMKAVVHFNGKRLAFLSTHLDAGSPVKRSADIHKQLCFLAGADPKDANNTPAVVAARLKHIYSGSFMFGDLNFRIAPPDGGVNIGGRKAIWKGMSPQLMAAVMCDTSQGGGREALYGCDQLNQSELVDPNHWNFTFPDFTNACWPTYKRVYGSHQKEQDVANFLANPTGANFCKAYKMTAYGDMGKKDKKKQVDGLDNDSLTMSKKRGEWDLGWLDRIGHLLNDLDAPDIGMTAFVDVPELVLSDHVCVAAKYSVG